jgi:hypothetical protein
MQKLLVRSPPPARRDRLHLFAAVSLCVAIPTANAAVVVGFEGEYESSAHEIISTPGLCRVAECELFTWTLAPEPLASYGFALDLRVPPDFYGSMQVSVGRRPGVAGIEYESSFALHRVLLTAPIRSQTFSDPAVAEEGFRQIIWGDPGDFRLTWNLAAAADTLADRPVLTTITLITVSAVPEMSSAAGLAFGLGCLWLAVAARASFRAADSDSAMARL